MIDQKIDDPKAFIGAIPLAVLPCARITKAEGDHHGIFLIVPDFG